MKKLEKKLALTIMEGSPPITVAAEKISMASMPNLASVAEHTLIAGIQTT